MDDTDECATCGHVRDEHALPLHGGECQVDDCDCIYFEEP